MFPKHYIKLFEKLLWVDFRTYPLFPENYLIGVNVKLLCFHIHISYFQNVTNWPWLVKFLCFHITPYFIFPEYYKLAMVGAKCFVSHQARLGDIVVGDKNLHYGRHTFYFRYSDAWTLGVQCVPMPAYIFYILYTLYTSYTSYTFYIFYTFYTLNTI